MGNFDKWSKFYDTLYYNYKDDIEFYKKQSKKIKGKVLEIACGTGRIYLELLKDGVDAYGIDVSEGMLKVLKSKANNLKLKPKVYRADYRDFRLKHKFSLIIFPFTSFLLNLTINDQLKTLRNIKNYLLPNGKLIVDFFSPNPEAIVKKYGKEIKKVIKTEQGKFIGITKSYFIDEPNQIIDFVNILMKDNKVIWKDKFRIKLIYKREFELLLKLAGFKNWKVYGGFNFEPLNSSKQRMIWVVFI